MGLAYVLEARVARELQDGSLRIVLEEHASPDEPLHIYYTSRRHKHPGLSALTNIMRTQQGLPPI